MQVYPHMYGRATARANVCVCAVTPLVSACSSGVPHNHSFSAAARQTAAAVVVGGRDSDGGGSNLPLRSELRQWASRFEQEMEYWTEGERGRPPVLHDEWSVLGVVSWVTGCRQSEAPYLVATAFRLRFRLRQYVRYCHTT